MENPCLMIMLCGDPKSSSNHSLKEVSACLVWYRVNKALGHPGQPLQGCLCYLRSTLRSYIFVFTIDKHLRIDYCHEVSDDEI